METPSPRPLPEGEGEKAEPSPPWGRGQGEGVGEEDKSIQDKIVGVLKTCYDPEIPVNVYDLGMVYEVKVDDSGEAHIRMTLTSPNCPAIGSLPGEIQAKVGMVEGVTKAHVDLVWDPPWNPSKMSEAAKLELGMM